MACVCFPCLSSFRSKERRAEAADSGCIVSRRRVFESILRRAWVVSLTCAATDDEGTCGNEGRRLDYKDSKDLDSSHEVLLVRAESLAKRLEYVELAHRRQHGEMIKTDEAKQQQRTEQLAERLQAVELAHNQQLKELQTTNLALLQEIEQLRHQSSASIAVQWPTTADLEEQFLRKAELQATTHVSRIAELEDIAAGHERCSVELEAQLRETVQMRDTTAAEAKAHRRCIIALEEEVATTRGTLSRRTAELEACLSTAVLDATIQRMQLVEQENMSQIVQLQESRQCLEESSSPVREERLRAELDLLRQRERNHELEFAKIREAAKISEDTHAEHVLEMQAEIDAVQVSAAHQSRQLQDINDELEATISMHRRKEQERLAELGDLQAWAADAIEVGRIHAQRTAEFEIVIGELTRKEQDYLSQIEQLLSASPSPTDDTTRLKELERQAAEHIEQFKAFDLMSREKAMRNAKLEAQLILETGRSSELDQLTRIQERRIASLESCIGQKEREKQELLQELSSVRPRVTEPVPPIPSTSNLVVVTATSGDSPTAAPISNPRTPEAPGEKFSARGLRPIRKQQETISQRHPAGPSTRAPASRGTATNTGRSPRVPGGPGSAGTNGTARGQAGIPNPRNTPNLSTQAGSHPKAQPALSDPIQMAWPVLEPEPPPTSGRSSPSRLAPSRITVHVQSPRSRAANAKSTKPLLRGDVPSRCVGVR